MDSSERKNSLAPVYILLGLATVLTLFPFIWMILTSFKSYEESIFIPPTILPEIWMPENYSTVWNKFPFGAFYVNTFFVAAVTTGIQLFICAMAAYAYARLEFPGKNIMFALSLALLMVPGQIFLIPHYEIMVGMKLNNTLTALWLPRVFSVFGVFMLRQFFMTLPRDLDAAAKIDGANYMQIFFRIMLPLLGPGLVSLGIITALNSWKELMWPIIINSDMELMTLAAGLSLLIGEHTTIYPLVMAGSVLAVWPMIVLFLIFQKQFIEGIATTGIKE